MSYSSAEYGLRSHGLSLFLVLRTRQHYGLGYGLIPFQFVEHLLFKCRALLTELNQSHTLMVSCLSNTSPYRDTGYHSVTHCPRRHPVDHVNCSILTALYSCWIILQTNEIRLTINDEYSFLVLRQFPFNDIGRSGLTMIPEIFQSTFQRAIEGHDQ